MDSGDTELMQRLQREFIRNSEAWEGRGDRSESSASVVVEPDDTGASSSTSKPIATWPTEVVELPDGTSVCLYGSRALSHIYREAIFLTRCEYSISLRTDGQKKKNKNLIFTKQDGYMNVIVFLSRTIQTLGRNILICSSPTVSSSSRPRLVSMQTNYLICSVEDFIPVFMGNDLPTILATEGKFTFSINGYQLEITRTLNPDAECHLVVEVVSYPSNR